LKVLQHELVDLKEQRDAMQAQWDAEKKSLGQVQALRESIEQVRLDIEAAERAYDLNKVAELRHGTLPALEKELSQAEDLEHSDTGMLQEEVTEEEIAQVVARWTGIPVTRLMEGEREKLLRLGDALHARVIGQDEAVQAVADAVLRARAGIKDPNRPIGSFIFLGPTGVGKTELARTLANQLFDSEDAMVRIDMSEYMEKHSVSRLIGAPPGYVGFEEGGQLTEAVRRKPYCVLLFDEIEKAHPDVFNILLQLLDDGRLTDSQGRTVSFKETVVMMTSNMGSDALLASVSECGKITEACRDQVMAALRTNFRPEFLNRVDDIVLFKPLSLQEVKKIASLFVMQLQQRLLSQQVDVSVGDDAMKYLAEEGYDPVYGARPMKRFIQQAMETPLARLLISGEASAGSLVRITCDDQGLQFTVSKQGE